MEKILPAGQHYGVTLESWSSDRLTVSRIQYAPGSSSDLHGNERASVMFVEEGLCVKQMGPRVVELSRETGMFLPPRWIQKDSFPQATTFLAAEFSNAFLELLHGVGPQSEHAIPVAATQSHALRSQLRTELSRPDPFSPLVLEGMLMTTVAQAGRSVSRRHHGRAPAWLLRAKELLRYSVGTPPTIEALALSTGVHPAHLSREFRRQFGCTLGEYGRQNRIDQAKSQLITTKLPLAEISLRLGFSDQAHFSRTFKRYTGSTPLEYRRSRAS
jgi:AraC-like DNA-binding protein